MKGEPPSLQGGVQEEEFMMHTLGYLASNSVHNVGWQSAHITHIGIFKWSPTS